MSYYLIAQIRINDESEYQEYINGSVEIFEKYHGKYLVVDNEPVLLEGDWNYTRTVLIRFDNRDDFDAWYNSDEYQKILQHRLKAADCDTILVKGLHS